MVSWQLRCLARSLTKRWRHLLQFAADQVPSLGPSASFANAIVVLYLISALLGAILYLYFRVEVRPTLEREGHWQSLGLFDLKEHFISIGLGLLPAYWVLWRRPCADESHRMRALLTAVMAFIVWWSFLIGHFLNNLKGFGL